MSALKNIWLILNSQQHRTAMIMLVWMFIGMVLETLGIGIIIPALGIMAQEDIITDFPMLAPWLNVLGNPTHEQLIAWGMFGLVFIYGVKTLFLAFLAWRQAKFVYRIQAQLSYKLFKGYMTQPYVFHLQRNSAELIRNTIGQVADASTVLSQSLVLITEILVLVGLSTLLIIVEPLGALVVINFLGLAGWVGHKLTRRKILAYGEARQTHEGKRIQHLQQGLGGVKEAKLLGRVKYFLSLYDSDNIGSARVAEKQVTLKALPKLGFEFLAVVGLAALVFSMLAQDKALNSILPTLGMFGAAAFRLLPSANRIVMALQSVKFYLPVIDNINNELNLLKNVDSLGSIQKLSFKKNLCLSDIGFKYPGGNEYVLDGINLDIFSGQSVGIIGGSGVGKSTLIDIILGLLKPDRGCIKVDGVDIYSNIRGWQDILGYVPQSIFLTDESLRHNIAFGVFEDEINDGNVWRAIKSAQLESFVAELPSGLDTKVGERGVRLSGGQRQRIGIARALYRDPEVLVLDEATSSLDNETEAEVMNSVNKLHGKKTLIIVAHRMSTVEKCDYLIRLRRRGVVDIVQSEFVEKFREK